MYYLSVIVVSIGGRIEVPERIATTKQSTVMSLFSSVKFKTFIILDLSDDGELFDLKMDWIMGSEQGPNCIYFFQANFKILANVKLIDLTHINILNNLKELQLFLTFQHGDYEYNEYIKYVFFIANFEEGDEKYLSAIMSMIWMRNMWNYNLVYFSERKLINFVYNPFSKKITTSSNGTNQMNKFNDLYGYNINVSMHHFTKDEDFLVLRSIEKILNATFQVTLTWSYEEIYLDVKEGRSEFSLVGQFHGSLPGVKYTEPIKPDHIVVLVSRSPILPQYLKLLLIFSPIIWIDLILVIVISIFVVYLVHRRNFNMIMLDLFRVLIGQSGFFRANVYRAAVRVFLISLSFFSIIVSNVYTSSLLSAILTVKYYPEIDTLEELRESNLSICTLNEYRHLIPLDFRNRTILMDPLEFARHILLQRNSSYAYAIMHSLADRIISTYVRRHGTNDFHMVQESFVPGFEGFIFNKKSPFIYKINTLLKTIQQSGLNRYNSGSKETRSIEFQGYTTLKLYHFATPFGILIIGSTYSIIIFALELIVSKFYPIIGQKSSVAAD